MSFGQFTDNFKKLGLGGDRPPQGEPKSPNPANNQPPVDPP